MHFIMIYLYFLESESALSSHLGLPLERSNRTSGFAHQGQVKGKIKMQVSAKGCFNSRCQEEGRSTTP